MDVLVINQQMRNPNRPSLTRKCDCGSGKLYKKCHGVDGGTGILTKMKIYIKNIVLGVRK